VLGVVVVSWPAAAFAQVAPPAPEAVAVGDWLLAPLAEARVRGEYWHDLDGTDRGVLLERARLGVDALRGAIEGRVVLQDARLWDLGAGSDTIGGPGAVAATGVYEAWGEAHTSGARPSFLRVGRQAVTWGEGRLLGVADWSPTGRTLDAVRGRLVVSDGVFELLAASLSDPDDALLAYGELIGARAEWGFDPLFAAEGYALARLAQANPRRSLEGSVHGETYTGALRLHGDGRGWTWGAEGALQLGRADQLVLRSAADRLAWAAAGHVAHTFQHTLLLPTVRLGASYASGDHGGSTYRAFDPLLPDVHAWHGAMDLFAWSNEADASARLSVAPFTDAIAAVEYRYVRLAEPGGSWRTAYLVTIGSLPGNTQADLGHELDAMLTWSPWVPVELSGGYSLLVLGDGARAILGALGTAGPPGAAHFGYLQATLRLP